MEERMNMKNRAIIVCVLVGTLFGSAAALADEDAASTGSHAAAYVKDSAITTKVKTKLAAQHVTSLGRIHVDTDKNGVVWLSGSAKTHEAAEKAESIARQTEGVKAVHNNIRISNED
jgi:hyperosmotically inducible protein